MMMVQPPALMDHWDDFNRPNATDLGPNYRAEYDACRVFNNKSQITNPAQFSSRQGAWETWIAGHNGGRLLTDNWEVIALIAAPTGSLALDNASAIGVGMFDNGPAAGMVLVYGMFLQGAVTSANAMAIYTYINPSIPAPGLLWGSGTPTASRAAVTNRVSPGDIMRFRRRMYSPTQSVFQLTQNGVLRCSWNDSTGIVPAGQRNRRRWFLAQEGNAAGLSSGQYYSPAIDSIRAYDRPY
ncbi:hypothetical protein [Nocardia carnea]|uniref:hypothetical protein n=1 Tax=Nocardia carnea TaxID=37328 RepID=UPI0024589D9E|nr:hypothetical protein [Nocardia carnea]